MKKKKNKYKQRYEDRFKDITQLGLAVETYIRWGPLPGGHTIDLTSPSSNGVFYKYDKEKFEFITNVFRNKIETIPHLVHVMLSLKHLNKSNPRCTEALLNQAIGYILANRELCGLCFKIHSQGRLLLQEFYDSKEQERIIDMLGDLNSLNDDEKDLHLNKVPMVSFRSNKKAFWRMFWRMIEDWGIEDEYAKCKPFLNNYLNGLIHRLRGKLRYNIDEQLLVDAINKIHLDGDKITLALIQDNIHFEDEVVPSRQRISSYLKKYNLKNYVKELNIQMKEVNAMTLFFELDKELGRRPSMNEVYEYMISPKLHRTELKEYLSKLVSKSD